MMHYIHFRRVNKPNEFNPDFGTGFELYREKIKACFALRENNPFHVNAEILEEEFKHFLSASWTDSVIAAIDDDKNVVGIILAGVYEIIRVYVVQEHRRQGHGFKMLELYLNDTKGERKNYRSTWIPEQPWYNALFIKLGFNIVNCVNEFYPMGAVYAEKDTQVDYYQRILDNNDQRGYEEFRGDYAVIDGHYTLEQLEAIYALGRIKLEAKVKK